jgi:hypothetical protein
MDLFEQARAQADEDAPPPVDQPLAAAATAFGFGLLVVGVFLAMQWFGLPGWLAWTGSAAAYGGIAYADCLFAWRRHRRAFHDALADLKDRSGARSVH